MVKPPFLETMYGLLKPNILDGNPASFVDVEEVAYAAAMQRFEGEPGLYDPLSDQEHIDLARQDMVKTYQALVEGKSRQRQKHVVYVYLEPSTRAKLKDPEAFLEKIHKQMEQYFEFDENGQKRHLRISFTLKPPKAGEPFNQIILNDSKQSYIATPERRLRAVKEMLNPHNESKSLRTLLDGYRRENPDKSVEGAYEWLAHQPQFLEEVPNSKAWTPLGEENYGNRNRSNISFVRIDPENAEKPNEIFEYATFAVHELGHQLGLQHPFQNRFRGNPMTLMNLVIYGTHSEDEKAKLAKKREEALPLLKAYKRDYEEGGISEEEYRSLEKSLLATSELQPRPTYLWGDQALQYLKYVLGIE